MSKKKKLLVLMLAAILLTAVVHGLMYHFSHYALVDFRFYSRNAEVLELNGQDISPAHYEKLRRQLPDMDIRWDVPLGNIRFPNDSIKITIDSLSETDLERLRYFHRLQQVDASQCEDYAQLRTLEQEYPDLEVRYQIRLGDTHWDTDAAVVQIPALAGEDLHNLEYLPRLAQVICTGGDGKALLQYCQNRGLDFALGIGSTILPLDTVEARLEAATGESLPLLQLLPQLKTVHIAEPSASADSLTDLQAALPHVQITWDKTVCGISVPGDAAEVDLSGSGDIRLDEIAAAMDYFPQAATVFLGSCGIDNETLAAFREEMRQQFKLVWTVPLGDKLTARTDDVTFMPVKHYVYYFNDQEAYNLRYCEDMICIDIGHMSIHNIDFVQFMPNLTYLILAHTQLSDITPISSCKNLKFLELDWAPLRDLSPLVGCTGLEDLNLGNTFADFAPIKQMTWLKNLWVINCNQGIPYKMAQALPNTNVQGAGSATVDSGWRNLQNYYDMRDLLGMHYMSW